MIKKIRNIVVASIATLTAAFVMIPAVAMAQAPAVPAAPDIDQGLCQGANLQVSAKDAVCDTKASAEAGATAVNGIITLVINIFSVVVGVVAVIMIIVGGLKYITSGGDSGNVTGAKNTILYAIIGLVVVALAQLVVKFVVGKSTNL